MVWSLSGCKVRSFLWVTAATLIASPVSADDLLTHGEIYNNLWQSNVTQALDRVRAEEQGALANDQRVLAGVRVNLAATLALYESPVESLPLPPSDNRLVEGRMFFAADEQEESVERRRGEDRPRRDEARTRDSRTREARAERDVREEREEREERELRRPSERERNDSREDRLKDSTDRRERSVRVRPELEDRGNHEPARSDEASPLTPPHPRILNALRTQQEQVKQLAERVERLERQLRERQSASPERDRPAARESLRDPREARERLARQAEEREHHIAEVRRQAMVVKREAMNARKTVLAQQQARLTQAQIETRIELERARQQVRDAEKQANRMSQELEKVEQLMEKLKQDMAQLSDQEQSNDDVELHGVFQSRFREMMRDAEKGRTRELNEARPAE